MRKSTALPKLENNIRCRRLNGLDIFHEWITIDFCDKQGTPGFQEEARSTATELERCVKKDLRKMDISWDEVEEDRRS